MVTLKAQEADKAGNPIKDGRHYERVIWIEATKSDKPHDVITEATNLMWHHLWS